MGELSLSTSRHFTDWLARNRVSLAFTTYQAGKLFLIGTRSDGRLSAFERTFSRCMGMWADGQTIWMSSLFQLWRFENQLDSGAVHEGYDAVYTPMVGHTTGDLDIHDVAVDADGRVVFVNTLFNCVATLSRTRSFRPLWQPGFISDLVPEDRCHLNGVAMRGGRPRYVTAVSATDVLDGWRDRRTEGGLAIDIDSNETVCAGLSMPHSPRWHNGRLWLVNSGTGYLGYVDDGHFVPVTFLPGYARGMVVVGNHAVVGLSRPRESSTFTGLTVEDELSRRGAEPRCALHVVDLGTGNTVEWLRIDGVVQELYDVVALPGVARPMALGFRTDEIQRSISIER